jgi:hypothetical protein
MVHFSRGVYGNVSVLTNAFIKTYEYWQLRGKRIPFSTDLSTMFN